MTNPMKPSVLLAKAKRLIETKGWCRGEYHKEKDGYCIFGAVGQAKSRIPDSALIEDVAFITEALGLSNDSDYRTNWQHPLAMWNDRKGRTKKQVLAAFDKAIKLAKEAGE